MTRPGRILGFAMFPLGLGALLVGITDTIQGHRSLSWPPIEATILSASLTDVFLATPQPEIRYQYTYKLSPHMSDRIWPGQSDLLPPVLPAAARQIVAEHPAGKKVTVYVDPSHPDMSVLIQGPWRSLRWIFIVFAIMALGVWAPFAMERWFK